MLSHSNAYFSVNHAFDAYLQPWDPQQPLPSLDQLALMLPPSLQLISDIKSLEADCLLQLRHLDNDAKTVVEFLKLQSRKIDMVLQHVMSKEEYEGQHYQGSHFGGSSIRLISRHPLTIGSEFKVSLHIKDACLAMICFANVQQCEAVNADDDSDVQFHIELRFSVIQDTDIEQLVKASLSLQQKQLKLRKIMP